MSDDKLQTLHENLAKEMAEVLEKGEEVVAFEKSDEGVKVARARKRPSPAMLQAIRQFLKDNGVEVDPENATHGAVGRLAAKVPFPPSHPSDEEIYDQ